MKNKSIKRLSPSHLCRKERRAADPALRQRAAQHQAREAATAPPMEEALPTAEKERHSSATSSLQVSPVKDNTREEAGDEQVAKEEADGEQWAGEVPKDYNEYANYSDWFWEHDVKRRDEARNSWVKRTGVASVIMNAHHQLNLRTKVASWGIS